MPARPPAASKTHSFFHHFFDALRDRFLMDFGSIFRPKLLPQTFQNPPKFDAKRHFILNFKFWSIFVRFFFDFAIFRRPGKALRYYNYNSFVAFAPLAAKCTNSQKLIPDEVPKTLFFHPKINFFHPSFDLQRHQKFDRCSHRYLCDLGPNLKPSWDPSWGLDRTKNRCQHR